MNPLYDRSSEILRKALAAFGQATGLRARGQTPKGMKRDRARAVVEVLVGKRPIRFAAEAKPWSRFETLGTIKAGEGSGAYPALLVAPYLSREAAKRCRELNLAFMDEAGNAYLEAPGLFIYIAGNPPPVDLSPPAPFDALKTTGLKIIFALLTRPDLLQTSYRAIAKSADVALGAVGGVLADLERRGQLTPKGIEPRRLLNLGALAEEWAVHYPVRLRPKLNPRRFTASDPDWWRAVDLRKANAWWGGEPAADKLTRYLKPERITIYTATEPDRLILTHRLRPDPKGEIEILRAFWRPEKGQAPETKFQRHDDCAPPLLVYADLIATTDSRNIEAAKLIYERYLANSFGAV
ncbi:hypothetical protein HYR69_01600 [Candidatus Sumerlaeota bacterium]|nr:hypothetical protein [Candidatus Sumerlaeota bacterium]